MTETITVSVADIREMGARRAGRVGRPRRGVAVDDRATRRSYRLSDDAADAVRRASEALGASESAVMEALAGALIAHF